MPREWTPQSSKYQRALVEEHAFAHETSVRGTAREIALEIYHQEGLMYDLKNLNRMKNLETHAPEAMRAFVAFDKAALAGGAIPRKYKELMALAVALTTQCPYCIELHSNKARETGALDPEIAEAVLVAAALRAGGAITHGTHAMKS
jgi:AhpD family alkylhydroperoxidase